VKNGLRAALRRRRWGCWFDEKLSMSQQGGFEAQKGSCILGCIKSRVGSRGREMIVSLFSALVRFHLEPCAQLWGPQHKKDTQV